VGQACSTVYGDVKHGHASKALRDHRRRIFKIFRRKHELSGMEALARRLGTSPTALHGMARGDARRYGGDKLESVLNQIGCSRAEWDFVDKPPTPA
jgi:hypothetical protein